MSFHNWYSKSIEEAQERYKKEDNKIVKEKEDYLYDMNYGNVDTGSTISDDDEDLLRLDTDYDNFKGVFCIDFGLVSDHYKSGKSIDHTGDCMRYFNIYNKEDLND